MAINLDAVGKVLGPETYEYDEERVILYALGIGVQTEELQFVYENGLKVIPTFSVVASRGAALNTLGVLNIPLEKLLHGENRIEVPRPLPRRAKFTATNTIKAIYDKGKGAVVVTEIEAKDEAGDLLFRNIISAFVRGEGGFGGDRGPGGAKNRPPDRAPDEVVSLTTRPDQAHIYRLSGDKNPLHIDPNFAKLAGFDRPILHGLCTYGYVARSVMRAFCDNDPDRLKALEVRFTGVVFPGETLKTEMWRDSEGKIVLQTKAGENRLVINHAAAEIE